MVTSAGDARWAVRCPRDGADGRLGPRGPEPGFALLEERPHAFALVRRPEQVQEQRSLDTDPVGSRRLNRRSDRVLRGGERFEGAVRERPGILDRLVEDRLRRVDRLHDAQPERGGRVQLHPRIHEVTRHPGSDEAGQSLRPAGARDHPERDLGLAELRIVRHVAEVAPERQLEAPAERVARDRGDRDLPDTFQQVAGIAERLDARAHLVLGPAGHRLDVGACREELRAAPHHERADVRAVVRFADRLPQLDADPQIDRVRRRAVDADHPDAVIHLETHELAHGGAAYPVSIAAAASRVARRPSTSGVRATPNAAAASGASARDGRAKNDAVTASNGTPRSRVKASAAACPEAWVGTAPSPPSSRAKPSPVTMSGPSRPHVPASSASSSSIAASTDATSSAKIGARSLSPGPTTNGGSASAPSTVAVNHRPPSPYACVERTIACSMPDARTASSARPFARRNGCTVSGSAPGTESSTNRFVPARFAASKARRTLPWFAWNSSSGSGCAMPPIRWITVWHRGRISESASGESISRT